MFREYTRGHSLTQKGAMGIYNIKPWFREQLQPLVKLLWNVHPDVLTWSALGVSILSGVLLFNAYDKPFLAVLVVPLLFIRLALNALDGMLAQQTGKARPAGEVLNELSDRMADVAIFLALALSPAVDKSWGVLAVICILIVSYVGILGKAVAGERVYTGLLGKADRMIYLMVACLIYGVIPNWTFMDCSVFGLLLLLFIPLSSITLLQRLDRIMHLLSDKEAR
jgi:CDP-diacylglycerol--glycerol-3-phosphate 3-phosphatidyltransferase